MSKEELTPEEAEMLEVMARDDVMDEPKEETSTEAETPEDFQEELKGEQAEQKPEFKSSRASDPPDWSKLTIEQQENVRRVLEGRPPEGFVPHGALHQTREELKALKSQIEAKNQPEPEQPPQYVDPLEDPEGHRRYVDYHNNQTAERVNQVQEQIQRQQQQAQIQQSVAQAEQQFMEQQGDYKDAIKFLQDTRMKDLTSQGYDPQSAMRQMSQDAMGIYQAAQMMGVNPAQLAYMRAQSLGYTNQPKQDDAQKMEALNKAQEQTSGISGGGAPQKGKLTLAALSEMSEAEIAEIPEAEIRKVMEG